MKRPLYFSIFYLSFCFSIQSLLGHELAVIRKVSKSRKTFIVNLGKEREIVVDQVSSFNNQQVAFLAKAMVVTREYSVWEVLSVGMLVPFQKNEIVNVNFNPESLWYQNPKAKHSASSVLTGDFSGRVSPQDGKKRSIGETSFGVIASYMTELSESISSVPAYDDRSRSGFSGDVFFHKRVFRELYLGLGGRYHREVSETPVYVSRTNRVLLLLEGIYHFRDFSLSNSHLFFGTRIGVGISRTKIPKIKMEGITYLIPAFTTGLEWVISKNVAIDVGISFESLKTSEKFERRVSSDDGIERQTVSQANLLGLVGIKTYFL